MLILPLAKRSGIRNLFLNVVFIAHYEDPVTKNRQQLVLLKGWAGG